MNDNRKHKEHDYTQVTFKSAINNNMNTQYTYLNWNGPIQYPGVIRIETIGDGSCFFHAIAKSYCEPYITGMRNGKILDRGHFIRGLREDLAKKLSSRINPFDPNSLTYYDTLSRGTLKEFSKQWPPYKLENLKNELIQCQYVDNVYIEFISNQINKDIYLLSMKTHDIYFTGDDYELLHKGRNSIVILYMPGHYELVGIEENNKIYTLFKPDHPFIQIIRDRIKQVTK